MAKVPHKFDGKYPRKKSSSGGSFVYCSKCGHVILKNEASRKAQEASCPDDRDV